MRLAPTRLVLAVLGSAIGCTGTPDTPPSGDSSPGDTVSGDAASGDTSSGDTNAGDSASGDTNAGDSASGDTNAGDTNAGDSASGDTTSGDSSSGDSDPLPTTCLLADNGATRCNIAGNGDAIVEQCDGSTWLENDNCTSNGMVCVLVIADFARCEVPAVFVDRGEPCDDILIKCTEGQNLLCAGTPKTCKTDCSANPSACLGTEHCYSGVCYDQVGTGLLCPSGSGAAACFDAGMECVGFGTGLATECRPICPSEKIGEVGTASPSTACDSGFACARNNHPIAQLDYEFGVSDGTTGGPVTCDISNDQCATLAGAGYVCMSLFVDIDSSGPTVIQEHVCAIDCEANDTCGTTPGPGYRCESLVETLNLTTGEPVTTRVCARPPGVCSKLVPLLSDLSPAGVEAALVDGASGTPKLDEMCDRPTYFMGDPNGFDIAGGPVQCEELADSQLCATPGSCDAATAVPTCQPIARGYVGTIDVSCTTTSDCNVDQPGNYVCEQGVCLHPCSQTPDCPLGGLGADCDLTSGFCYAGGEPSPELKQIICNSDTDCAGYGLACASGFSQTNDVCAVFMTACAAACSLEPGAPDLFCPTGMTCQTLPVPGPGASWYLTAPLSGEPDGAGGFQMCPNDDPPGNRECSGSYYCETFDPGTPSEQKICVWSKKFCQ